MATHRRMRLGRWLLAAAVLGVGLAAPASVAGAQGPDPVVLVHGYRGGPSSWADMKAYLEAQGRTVVAIDLPSENNVTNAGAIASLIASRGWSRADLVGQSMGGLSARHLVKFLKIRAVIDSYVSIGTPQYGITSACLLPSWYGGQMCPSSAFLRDLNRNDDTPGGTKWTTIYSTGDLVVPNSSSRLDGGACFVRVTGVGHNEMDNDARVMGATAAALDGTCTGTFQS
jgi:triacylglycerol lipase